MLLPQFGGVHSLRPFELRPAFHYDQVIDRRLFAPVMHNYSAPVDQHRLQHRAEHGLPCLRFAPVGKVRLVDLRHDVIEFATQPSRIPLNPVPA